MTMRLDIKECLSFAASRGLDCAVLSVCYEGTDCVSWEVAITLKRSDALSRYYFTERSAAEFRQFSANFQNPRHLVVPKPAIFRTLQPDAAGCRRA